MSNEICSDDNIQGDAEIPLNRFKCSSDQWNDWQWQIKNRIMSIEKLKDIFPKTSSIPINYPYILK